MSDRSIARHATLSQFERHFGANLRSKPPCRPCATLTPLALEHVVRRGIQQDVISLVRLGPIISDNYVILLRSGTRATGEIILRLYIKPQPGWRESCRSGGMAGENGQIGTWCIAVAAKPVRMSIGSTYGVLRRGSGGDSGAIRQAADPLSHCSPLCSFLCLIAYICL